MDACSAPERWRDNPREALKGLTLLSETFAEPAAGTTGNFLDETGVYSSTAHSTYRLRQLYAGLDGREVRQAFVSASDTYLYDIASFTAHRDKRIHRRGARDGAGEHRLRHELYRDDWCGHRHCAHRVQLGRGLLW